MLSQYNRKKYNLEVNTRICHIWDKSFTQLHNPVVHYTDQHNQLQGLVDDKFSMDLKNAITTARLTKEEGA